MLVFFTWPSAAALKVESSSTHTDSQGKEGERCLPCTGAGIPWTVLWRGWLSSVWPLLV